MTKCQFEFEGTRIDRQTENYSMIGKIVGGVLGFVGGGPIGALIGFGIGSLFDDNKEDAERSSYTYRGREYITSPEDFSVSLLVLSAAMMKADGKVLKSELDFVKQWFVQQFGVEKTKDYMLTLKDLLKKEIPLRDVTLQIRQNMSMPNRHQMIQYLCQIALADGHVDQEELRVLHTISHYLGIHARDLESIKAMYFRTQYSSGSSDSYRRPAQSSLNDDLKILGLNSSATNDEIKKAYRKLAIKYHPDKVANLGEEHQKAAKDKFQKLTAAYDRVKEVKGIK